MHEDQVGYIKGRDITTIIRLVDDVVEFLRYSNKTGAILALDFSKAFDTINKKFLIEVLQLYGFGTDFINWVNVITKDTESCLIFMLGGYQNSFQQMQALGKGAHYLHFCL